jgi:hypothetical protein
MTTTDLTRELSNLKIRYRAELVTLQERVTKTIDVTGNADRYSDHDAFNMAATCQNLAVLAGKIEQTSNVLRWMDEAKS